MLRHVMRFLSERGQADTGQAESSPASDSPGASDIVRGGTVDDLTISPETVLIRELTEADGPLKQQELLERTEWAPATLSKRLTALEELGHITRFRLGREKVVCLPDEVPDALHRDCSETIPEAEPTGGESTLLVAEDNPAERRLLQEALTDCASELSPIFVTEGPDVFAMLANEGEYAGTPPPELLILDVGLPRMDGKEVLRRLRGSDDWRSLPVVIFSNRNDSETIADCYELGANAYYTKPDGYEELRAQVRVITESWLGRAELPEAY